MPYVQSEGVFLYSLHRGARGRGLQAKREREFVPSLCGEKCRLQGEAPCPCGLFLFFPFLELVRATSFYSHKEEARST